MTKKVRTEADKAAVRKHKKSIWLSDESLRIIGDRNRSGTINAMIERVGAVADWPRGINEKEALAAYELLPKKINGKGNPNAYHTLHQFASELKVSMDVAIILLEQIESGKL